MNSWCGASRARGRDPRRSVHAGARRALIGAALLRHGAPHAHDASDAALDRAYMLAGGAARPRCNLNGGARRDGAHASTAAGVGRVAAATSARGTIAEEDVAITRDRRHGSRADRTDRAGKRPGEPVNVLTHCNAGLVATVDWGTATASTLPRARSRPEGHVWVDETGRAIRALR